MDGPKILEVVNRYRKHFTEQGIKVLFFPEGVQINSDGMEEIMRACRVYFAEKGIRAQDFPHDKIPGSKEEMLAHCHGMMPKMEGFIKERRIEKTLRWLGFILGCFWSLERSHCSKEEMLAYCHGTLDKIEDFVGAGRLNDAFVWLGFVQGCLWSAGHYTLEDLKNHNRPVE